MALPLYWQLMRPYLAILSAQLRQHGFDDRSIHDTVQIIGYFNYINRVADALGVEPEFFIQWGNFQRRLIRLRDRS